MIKSIYRRGFLRYNNIRSGSRSLFSFHPNDIDHKGSSIGNTETDEWFVFPRETEGNIYSVNWSLVVDGVTPTKKAYRDARLTLLNSHLPNKPADGKVELKNPIYFGDYKMLEAGSPSLSLESFTGSSEILKEELSSKENLYVEDAALGSYSCVRIGVRIVTENPALALISRSLLISIPPRPCNHMSRFNGWNFDPRWQSGVPDKHWNGEKYDIIDKPTPKQGTRPIVAFVGGDNNQLSVEFIQNKESLVGANIIAGSKTPVRGLIEAIGHATTVLVNEQQSMSLALPSSTFVKDKSTCVVIGSDDSINEALYANKSLYGAYHNILTSDGVSACWNGVLGSATPSNSPVPSVVVLGKCAVALPPDNLAPPATHIVFYEKGAKKASISEEEAVKKIIALVGGSKTEIASKLIKGLKISSIGSASDLGAIL